MIINKNELNCPAKHYFRAVHVLLWIKVCNFCDKISISDLLRGFYQHSSFFPHFQSLSWTTFSTRIISFFFPIITSPAHNPLLSSFSLYLNLPSYLTFLNSPNLELKKIVKLKKSNKKVFNLEKKYSSI